jgi:hypothetical protein
MQDSLTRQLETKKELEKKETKKQESKTTDGKCDLSAPTRFCQQQQM